MKVPLTNRVQIDDKNEDIIPKIRCMDCQAMGTDRKVLQ